MKIHFQNIFSFSLWLRLVQSYKDMLLYRKIVVFSLRISKWNNLFSCETQ